MDTLKLNSPLVSIIVPCYNQAQYLSETLQSVLDQELQEWECIIVNDGSPDDTEVVALEWCQKDCRFKYLKKENGGVSDARNFGVKNSRGKYILPLDADDKISKVYTIEASNILELNSDVRLVFCRVMLFGDMNKEWILLPYTYLNQLFVRNCIHCSAIYRRSDFDKTQGYNINMKNGWEDYDFWLSLIHPEDKIIRLEDFHLYYRIKSVSRNSLINRLLESDLRLQIFKNHQDIYLKYMNPIEMYKAFESLKTLESSREYKLGRFLLSPFRYIRNLFRKGRK